MWSLPGWNSVSRVRFLKGFFVYSDSGCKIQEINLHQLSSWRGCLADLAVLFLGIKTLDLIKTEVSDNSGNKGNLETGFSGQNNESTWRFLRVYEDIRIECWGWDCISETILTLFPMFPVSCHLVGSIITPCLLKASPGCSFWWLEHHFWPLPQTEFSPRPHHLGQGHSQILPG